jgi:hypothetical protein
MNLEIKQNKWYVLIESAQRYRISKPVEPKTRIKNKKHQQYRKIASWWAVEL